ncbi:MAG: hypothetical protein ABIP41_09430 [Croceibacterium sp.]
MIRSIVLAALLLGACHPSKGPTTQAAVPGGESRTAWSGVGPADVLHFTGTEPFWGGEASGSSLTWKTPEDQAGATIAVTRFAGRNGLGLSGTLGGAPFDMAVSAARCSDGMSGRKYPFTVTVRRGRDTLRGCGWTAAHPVTGADHP